MKNLSREEMRNVFAGVADGGEFGGGGAGPSRCKSRHVACYIEVTNGGQQQGTCEQNSADKCICNTGTSSAISTDCVL